MVKYHFLQLQAKPPRRESNDQYNDETFGSSENLSQERVDEERRRRGEFISSTL